MAINVFKSGGIGRYYFKENNIEYGPFQLDWMLQFVDADTPVKVSNSKWCLAKQHPDFIKYFNIKEVVKPAIPYTVPIEPVKNNYSNLIIGLGLVVVVLLFGIYIFKNSNKNESDDEIARQKQMVLDSIAVVNAQQQNLLQQQQDSINNLNTNRLDSLKESERKLIFLQNQNMIAEKILNYYSDIINNNFNANNYYADQVFQYITLNDVTPDEINDVLSNKDDYTNENIIFDKSTFVFQRELDNVYYFNYSINYSCFRTRKNKTQTCDVDIEIGFDEEFKIKSYKEMNIRNLTFE
jgi:hypothetical protein